VLVDIATPQSRWAGIAGLVPLSHTRLPRETPAEHARIVAPLGRALPDWLSRSHPDCDPSCPLPDSPGRLWACRPIRCRTGPVAGCRAPPLRLAPMRTADRWAAAGRALRLYGTPAGRASPSPGM